MAIGRRNQDQYMLRLPDGLREGIKASAEANNRSMNSEILARLTGCTESLRDKFAGQAISGLFNHSGWVATHDGDGDEIAKRAYAIADAMMAARKAGA